MLGLVNQRPEWITSRISPKSTISISSTGRYRPSARHDADTANSCSRWAKSSMAPGDSVSPREPSVRCKSLAMTSISGSWLKGLCAVRRLHDTLGIIGGRTQRT